MRPHGEMAETCDWLAGMIAIPPDQDADPRNARSLELLARLGFHETGRAARTWQLAEAWCDSVYLRLDAPR